MTKRIAILMCSRHLRFDKVRTAREQVLAGEGQAHYMRGGKPGYFPSLKKNIPHPIPLDFWDPLGFTKRMSDDRKAASLRAEVAGSARAHNYILSEEVQKTSQFLLLTVWLLTFWL